MTRPKSATAHWLRKLGVEPVDFPPPRSGEREGVEVIARVQKDCLEKVLRGSGEFGVFSRTFYARGGSRVYKDVQLPEGFDLQTVLRKAKAIGSTILGGRPAQQRSWIANQRVRRREGCWTDLDSRGIQEATNLPLSWSKAAVQAFLSGWPCTVEATYRAGKTRGATARSTVPPLHHRLQHDCGCALIRFAEPRKRPSAQGRCLVKTWQNHDREPNCSEILGKCCPRRPDEGHDCRSATCSTTCHCGKSIRKKGAGGHDLHWCFSVTGPGPRSSCNTALSRVRFSAERHAKFWCRPLTQVPNSTQVPAQISLSPRTHRVSGHCHTASDAVTTVGQLGGQIRSLHAEIRGMKMQTTETTTNSKNTMVSCQNSLALGDGAMVETGEPKLKSARHAPCRARGWASTPRRQPRHGWASIPRRRRLPRVFVGFS